MHFVPVAAVKNKKGAAAPKQSFTTPGQRKKQLLNQKRYERKRTKDRQYRNDK
jgi:hypothetical protein